MDLYLCVKKTAYLFFLIFYRLKIYGAENVPKDGGLIAAPNHHSNLDPAIIGSMFSRDDLFFLAKKELFDVPVFGGFIRRLKAFPINRGRADVQSLKTSIGILNNGSSLLVFPAGTRFRKNKKIVPQKGLGMLAKKTQVPIIPIKIINSDKWFLLKRLKVVFGKPIYVDKFEDYREISEFVLKKIDEIRDSGFGTRD